MTNPQTCKLNNASMNVLYTMMTLLDKPLTMKDLINAFAKYSPCNNFVISKYINTCRFCKFDIIKYSGKYILRKLPIKISFTQDEEDLITNNLVNNTIKSNSKDLINTMSEFLFKLCRLTSFDANVEHSLNKNPLLSEFEESLYSELMVEIITKDGKSIICSPVELKYIKDNTIFSVFYNDEMKDIPLDKVSSIQKTSRKILTGIIPHTVTFKLMKDLAKRYSTRAHERIINIEADGSIIVSNRSEDKEELMKRLMRYDEKCEIISPKILREEFKTKIDKTLENYSIRS
ncbi:WYL domain-containing protein [bacterium]|nr:WYL domain-containing protein [bacterium]